MYMKYALYECTVRHVHALIACVCVRARDTLARSDTHARMYCAGPLLSLPRQV